jgi:hypothetical protein
MDRYRPNWDRRFDRYFGVWFAAAALFTIAFWVVVIWAIITLVNHFT